jgi:hypothetical protein
MNKKEKLNDTPWQFEPGDVVYIAGHKQQPAKVTATIGCGRSGWPYYFVFDYQGHEWRVPQQCLSSSPVVA